MVGFGPKDLKSTSMITDRRTHSGDDAKPRYGCRTCIQTGPKNQSRERIIRFDHHFASLEEDHPAAVGVGDGLIIIVKRALKRRRARARETDDKTDFDLDQNTVKGGFGSAASPMPTRPVFGTRGHHQRSRWWGDLPRSSLDRCRLEVEVFAADLKSPSLQLHFHLSFLIFFVKIFRC